MACNQSVITGDLTLDCSDVPVGGIIAVYVARFDDVTSFVDSTGEVTNVVIVSGTVVNLEFNPKDGFSQFTDTKTVDEGGSVIATPELTLEFPKTTLSKRNALEKIVRPNSEYVIFIEAASGVRHVLGLDFGMGASEGKGMSGASRSDKNKYELTFAGEETNLARTIDDTAWAQVIAALKP